MENVNERLALFLKTGIFEETHGILFHTIMTEIKLH
jgi:hypothetical protein